MSQNLDQDNITPTERPKDNREYVKRDFKGLLKSTKTFLRDLLDIRANIPIEKLTKSQSSNASLPERTPWR